MKNGKEAGHCGWGAVSEGQNMELLPVFGHHKMS